MPVRARSECNPLPNTGDKNLLRAERKTTFLHCRFLDLPQSSTPLIVEVKYERQITPWFEQLFRIITPICDRAGYDFLVYTERKIMIEPLLSTIKRLRYYSRTPIYPHHQLLCHEFFATREESTLEEIFDFFAERNVDKSVVLALLYRSVISTDLSIPLGLSSPICYSTTQAENKEDQS